MAKYTTAAVIFALALTACGAIASQQNAEIFNDERALYSYIKKFGPKQTIAQLHGLSSAYGNCHNVAHAAGHFSYQIYKEKAFKECGSECHSGCYHGATEAFFKEHGTKNLQQNLKTLCSFELNSFFTHQCIHGIGHGLMAWTDYDLPEALKSCDLLDQGRESCYTGVFMENIVGTLGKATGHSTKYISDDPLFPCTAVAVEEKYLSSCYFLQTSRMIQLFGVDFRKIAESCQKAPPQYQGACFDSMGRDVGGTLRGQFSKIIESCNFAPAGEMRVRCFNGAVQDHMWDPSGQDAALTICKMLGGAAEKNGCYETLFERAAQIIPGPEERRAFCEKTEDAYRKRCLDNRAGGIAQAQAINKKAAEIPKTKNRGPSKKPVVIIMGDAGFSPHEITVARGQAVVFVNRGNRPHWPASNIHPSHQIYPQFDALHGLAPGESWSFVFSEEGVWRYHDHLEPGLNGKVNVE